MRGDEKKMKNFPTGSKSCVIVLGFADRGEVDQSKD